MAERRPARERHGWLRTLAQLLLISLAVNALTGINAHAEDWPAYRHDAARSNATGEKLAFPMREAWRYRAAQAPSPAWPRPYHTINRLDFDYAFHPVTGGGLVYFASSADDAVRALDAKTGEPRWTFVTGGPVRFAPQYVKGKLYLGSDDGLVYCLDATAGTLVWKFRAAPYEDMFVGNGRMISRWPIRTGVLVMENTVYFAAGMWSADGVHVCALNAETGAVIWRNDNTGYTGVFYKGNTSERTTPVAALPKNTTHEGEFGATGITPQGALLADGDILLIPTGISFPARFNRTTGALKPWDASFSAAPGVGGVIGGSWACIDRGFVYSLYKYRQDVLGLFSTSLAGGGRGGTRAALPQVDQRAVASPLRPKDFIHDKGKASIVVINSKVYSRYAYSLALAGTTLVIGLDGAVVAQDADTEREFWRAPVDGVARELAIADGRVFVSTESGAIQCFEAGKTTAEPIIHDPAASLRVKPAVPLAPADVREIEQIRAAGMDRGFALVLGDSDARFSLALAAATELSVVNVLTDEADAAALRNRLVKTTAVYGSRIHVATVQRLDRLPFARYFANAVIVAQPVAGMSGSELYRVLHPYGGVLLMPGLTPAQKEDLIKDTGAGHDEVKKGSAVVRGPIAGARDWDKAVASDRAAGGPMRVLWFGGPDTSQTQNFRESANFPVVASGRYFALSENRFSCVDAYNGTVYWSRMIPRKNRDLREIDGVTYLVSEGGRPKQDDPAPDSAAVATDKPSALKHAVDDSEMVPMVENSQTGGGRSVRVAGTDKVYFVLGQGADEVWIEVDSRTGGQRNVLRKWVPPPIVSLTKPQTWPIEVDTARAGAVSLTTSADGLIVTLTRKEPASNKLDTWDLYFDFRPLQKRCGLYERGAFHFVITPPLNPNEPTVARNGTGPAHPRLQLAGERTAGGNKATITIPWSELEKITGSRPSSFGFAATLNTHEGARGDAISRRHLFGDWASEAINSGWANMFIGDAPESVEPPSIVAPPIAELRRKYPDHERNRDLQPTLDDPAALMPRVHPLTGEVEPKIYRPGTGGCGGPYYTSTARFGRATGMLGLYDFIDDSGLRNLSGVKAGCSTPITAALGVVIISPEGGHCVCTFPFATTVTLAPADRRLNEDWAIFHDRPADTLVRQAAINLGAFGDRRDDHGTLWLGFPRPAERAVNFSFAAGTIRHVSEGGIWPHFLPAAMRVPLTIEYLDPARSHRPEEDLLSYGYWATWTANRLNREFGPFRVNTDVVPITGTENPWLYGHGYRGLKKATLQLDFRKPLIARDVGAGAVPKIDGKFDATQWGDEPDATLKYTNTQVFLRQDKDHLYIAMKRPTFFNRLGATVAWTAKTRGEDASVWDDDSCEVFIGDATGGKAVHLGVSASGARFDALVGDASSRKEDRGWNGAWTSAAVADDTGLCVELAIPFKTLDDAGFSRDRVGVNFQVNQRDTSGQPFLFPGGQGLDPQVKTRGEALTYLGGDGREHCRNFTPLGLGKPPAIPPRRFTVRLHFAELDDAKPGQRVFDVKLQDQVVLKAFDIVKEAGGPRKALVKEFKGVRAGEALALEFVPAVRELTATTAPVLCALELMEEGFEPPVVTVGAANPAGNGSRAR